ncbi:MAG: undecaprenyldiphospho-muramoylpentapeptide beta-N-acetylglucosaminyltransferase [Deltaproteobacteria bacterium]|nr:MAG: undecaprenyldiphospho-muramoylpentapeptide beta-N-acetylglucosaminyltransferase [Deltaproteobacteria bacterium]
MLSTQNKLHVVIAGGGTGGHLFPGIAIAEAFMEKIPDCRILFIGTDRPFEKSILAEKEFDHEAIFVQPLKGKSLWSKLAAMVVFPWSIYQAVRKMRRFDTDLVVGLGGYSAAPVAIGAWLMGIRIVIHEQNILPGLTNRLLSRLASRVYVSFENTRIRADARKIFFSGNPVRREVLRVADEKKDASHASSYRLTVLVLGGSQGAHSLNMAVADALDELKDVEGLYFIHQTGKADEMDIKTTYAKHDIPCRVAAFFSDIDRQYARADLLICRAGATTVAEAAVLGKACIFVPYPFAADNHQEFNARALVKAGAAGMILDKDLDAQAVARLIRYYLSNTQAVTYMAEQAKRFGRPHAAEDIINDCLALLKKKRLLALFFIGLSVLKIKRTRPGC